LEVTAVYPEVDHFEVLDPANDVWQQAAAAL
jgi:hypothetical protein